MNIYIPNINFILHNKKSLFILTRPFWSDKGWANDSPERKKWGISEDFCFTSDIKKADAYFIPNAINNYSRKELDAINLLCKHNNIKAYGYVAGDFGKNFGDYDSIIFFRMGGFKSQLGKNNKGFPVALSDHFQRIFHHDHPIPSEKSPKPTIGFCGHASLSQTKRYKELIKCFRENISRFIEKPKRKDWEPFFASAYERAKLLRCFERFSLIETNFIYRNHYRAGALTENQRTKTTIEYYNNISDSDYILCIRGAGNFSVRLYETLMMGKIPVFVNTDCLLPFEEKIDWKQHVVWIEWEDREKIATIVADFHNKITPEEFIQIQINNRILWKETLSINNMIRYLN